jgi:sec-independent protein translocase protein TatC
MSTAASPSIQQVSHRLTPLRDALVVLGAVEAMTFLEHLDELRRRLLWSVVSVAAAFGVCWVFATDLYDLASAPIRANPAVTLAIARPQDIFSLHMKVALVAALFLAAPLVLLQAWIFIAPGLHPQEKRYAIPFVVSGSLLFVAGGAFGYFVAFPAALTFLLDWTAASHLVPIIDAMEYFDLFFSIMVALGIVFQIPAVIFVLSRVGLVTAGLLVRYFKHAIVASVVLAAVLTPTTDFGNMLIVAGPMIALYTVGIGIAFVFGRS